MLQNAAGIAHKSDIAPIMAQLGLGSDNAIPVGDDCAAIPDGDGFLLLAIEGFIPAFVASDPFFAGYCGIMVNLSDIAAMGGRAIAVVDALWSQSPDHAAPLLAGLKAASACYQIPILGGHTNTRAGTDMLSVAILGRAKNLLTSFDALPDENIIAAIDLRGRLRDGTLYWDATSEADPARLRADLEILPEIAEAGVCQAAKDISMAGVVGTTMMLLEASRIGGMINLAAIPRPSHIPLEQWLLAFPSYGYVLSVAPGQSAGVIAHFAARGIAAAIIGTTDASAALRLRHDDEETMLWRFDEAAFTGCARVATDA